MERRRHRRNHYFPPDAIKWEYFVKSEHRTTCPWKGIASYYDIQVGGKVNPNAAWTYPHPSQAAQNIQDHVAFWRGVKII
jgi:uncharacterized protein (DUF427 family)